MKKITHSELLALFPKVADHIEKRLSCDQVDGMIVFEREDGRKTACVFGASYGIKRWKDADGTELHVGHGAPQPAIAYYEKPPDRDGAQARPLSKD